ncbi:MAG: ATP-binding cassette domain-containing protein [Deltaproteobacteria bacterium]|nr:ATP-binding cassette domain-containing protein [Deltaproteobacteria bacterium]
MIERITVTTGHGRNGEADGMERLELRMGDVVSIVGPTGSGKTTLINDIELFADGDTPSGRRVLIDGARPPAEYRHDPARHPIALITQHTTFLSDLPVGLFLSTHAKIRCTVASGAVDLVEESLAFANQLTGEPIEAHSRMTELSGGQTRALLIADAAIICSTPIVLLDEVENAGIHRTRAIELLRRYRKIFIFVTHDPRIALLSDYRVVMKNGRITAVLHTDEAERIFAVKVSRLDDAMSDLRDRLRHGMRLDGTELRGLA